MSRDTIIAMRVKIDGVWGEPTAHPSSTAARLACPVDFDARMLASIYIRHVPGQIEETKLSIFEFYSRDYSLAPSDFWADNADMPPGVSLKEQARHRALQHAALPLAAE